MRLKICMFSRASEASPPSQMVRARRDVSPLGHIAVPLLHVVLLCLFALGAPDRQLKTGADMRSPEKISSSTGHFFRKERDTSVVTSPISQRRRLRGECPAGKHCPSGADCSSAEGARARRLDSSDCTVCPGGYFSENHNFCWLKKSI